MSPCGNDTHDQAIADIQPSSIPVSHGDCACLDFHLPIEQMEACDGFLYYTGFWGVFKGAFLLGLES